MSEAKSITLKSKTVEFKPFMHTVFYKSEFNGTDLYSCIKCTLLKSFSIWHFIFTSYKWIAVAHIDVVFMALCNRLILREIICENMAVNYHLCSEVRSDHYSGRRLIAVLAHNNIVEAEKTQEQEVSILEIDRCIWLNGVLLPCIFVLLLQGELRKSGSVYSKNIARTNLSEANTGYDAMQLAGQVIVTQRCSLIFRVEVYQAEILQHK